MYDELKERCRACSQGCIYPSECSYFDKPPLRCMRQLLSDASDAIEKLSKAQEQWIEQERSALLKSIPRWIPVTEALPECDLGAEVGNIEWISCGMVHAGCFGRGGKYRDAYFRTWTDAGEGMDAKDADYWRAVALPEPPKEGKT